MTNGCYHTDEVDVVIRFAPGTALTDQTVCEDNLPLTLNAGQFPRWVIHMVNRRKRHKTIQVNSEGDYYVTVTNEYGCTGTGSSTVTIGNEQNRRPGRR